MSWMDSWSRPSKSQATPAPYYLLPGGETTPYCHSCGRVIGQRKTNAAATAKTEARYCSSRCRHHKPGKLDREIEAMFVRLLNGQEALEGTESKALSNREKRGKGKKFKGDQRILAPCSAVEDLVFGKRDEGGSSTRSSSPEPETEHEEHRAVEPDRYPRRDIGDDLDPMDVVEGTVRRNDEYVDGDVLARLSIRSGARVRPAQDVSEVNGSVGGEKGRAERVEENEEMLEKRRLGQKRAKEKEMVKCAARRGVVFGFVVGGDEEGGTKTAGERKLCEAVMSGKVVEPSFAKGDWSVRWRE